MQCRLISYQIIHFSKNNALFSYAVYYCAIILKDTGQSSSLHHVVLSVQFNHTVYPQHYSKAKCTPTLLTANLTQPTTYT